MNTRSEKEDLRDQEIIELTEVVEEPTASSAGSPQFGIQDKQSQDPNGHTGEASSRRQGSGHDAGEDDFDFSALLQDSKDYDGQNSWTDRSHGTQKRGVQSSARDFDDLEDLFDELDLDLPPEQDTRTGQEGMGIGHSQDLFQEVNRRFEEMDSRIANLENLHNLESRIQELEARVRGKESWSEIEARIMSRLEDLVREKTTEIKQAVFQEIDLKSELWSELSQRIEEVVPQAAAKIIREEIRALQEEDLDSGEDEANL
ncbi:MAG: hypothetical protein U5L00_01185 [Desulfovermiculus sp.]|nr:hypothetical protein [Desulfovermiculus sp.]